MSARLKLTYPPGKNSALTASTAQQNSLVLMWSQSGFLGMHCQANIWPCGHPSSPTVHQPACVSPGAAVSQGCVRRAGSLLEVVDGGIACLCGLLQKSEETEGRQTASHQPARGCWPFGINLAGTYPFDLSRVRKKILIDPGPSPSGTISWALSFEMTHSIATTPCCG